MQILLQADVYTLSRYYEEGFLICTTEKKKKKKNFYKDLVLHQVEHNANSNISIKNCSYLTLKEIFKYIRKQDTLMRSWNCFHHFNKNVKSLRYRLQTNSATF